MSFVLKQTSSYTWPVSLELPTNGGKKVKSKFTAEYARLPQSRINEIAKLAKAAEYGKTSDEEELDDKTAAKEILVGWSEVVDDDGEEVDFTPANLELLLEIPTAAGQLIAQWLESMELAKKPTLKQR